jgi:hypothetical protein
LTNFAEVLVAAAGLDAALPSGGIKTGTTNADRIIKTAKPTRTSTTVTCHFRIGFFMEAFLSPLASGKSNSISKLRESLPYRDYRYPLSINELGAFKA